MYLCKAISISYSSRWFYVRDIMKLIVATLYTFLNLQIMIMPWAEVSTELSAKTSS